MNRVRTAGDGTRNVGDCVPWTPADDKSLERFMWMQPAAACARAAVHDVAPDCTYPDAAGSPAHDCGRVARETWNGSAP